MVDLNTRQGKEALDKWITGNYGEDMFLDEQECSACGKSMLDKVYKDKGRKLCEDCFREAHGLAENLEDWEI